MLLPVWTAGEPPLDLWRLVRLIVVHDHVDVFAPLNLAFDEVQKFDELLMAVAFVALADDLAGLDVQRGKQVGHAVSEVVVRGSFGRGGHHRQ